MASLTVSLPDLLSEWIEKQIEAGTYATSSDYVGDLVRRDQEDKQKIAALRHVIQRAEESGMSSRSLEEIFSSARSEAHRRGLLSE